MVVSAILALFITLFAAPLSAQIDYTQTDYLGTDSGYWGTAYSINRSSLDDYLRSLGAKELTTSTDDGRIGRENTGLLADRTHRVTSEDGSILNSVYGKVAEQTNLDGVLTANTAPEQSNSNAGYYAFVKDFFYDSNAGYDSLYGYFALSGDNDNISFVDLYINGNSMGFSDDYGTGVQIDKYLSLTGLFDDGILREGNNNFSFVVNQQNSTGQNTADTLGFQAQFKVQEGPREPDGPGSDGGTGGNSNYNDTYISNENIQVDGTYVNAGTITDSSVFADDKIINESGASIRDTHASTMGNGTIENAGEISGGSLNSGTLINSGTINGTELSVNTLHNGENGYISTANVNSNGFLGNLGNIGTVNITGGYVGNGYYHHDGNYYNSNAAHIEQVQMNDGTLYNSGNINRADVFSGTLENGGNGNISYANFFGGVNHENRGYISVATIGYSDLHNNGHISNAHIYGGMLTNYENGTISYASVIDGTLSNWGSQYSYDQTNSIGNAQVNSGTLNNEQYGRIGSADIYGGELNNGRDNSYIETANVYGGILNNYAGNQSSSTIGKVNVNGGTVYNDGILRDAELSSSSGELINNGFISGNTTITAGVLRNYGHLGALGVDALHLEGNVYGNVTVSGGGLMNDGGEIGNVTVSGNGFLTNYVGEILSVDVRATSGTGYSGDMENVYNANGKIETANVYSGSFRNQDGEIINANVEGGKLDSYGGVISQANVSGGELLNFGSTISTANVSGGTFYTEHANVNTATVTGGTLNNELDGNITTANVYGGTLNNDGERYHAGPTTIGTANLDGGTLNNKNGGKIGTANVYSGDLLNGLNYNDGSEITQANVEGGRLKNYATVNSATVSGGQFENRGGTLNTATVNGGWFGNYDGTVNSATVSGGEFRNDGTVNSATVSGNGFFSNFDAVETATLSSGQFLNYDTVNAATLNGGQFENKGGTVNTAMLSGGLFSNYEMVNSAILTAGTFQNRNYGTVEAATLNGGYFGNDGTLNTATINGGQFENKGDTGTVNTATIDGGYFGNEGTVDSATLSGSGVFNNKAKLNSAMVSGGTFDNRGGTVSDAEVTGGQFGNTGTVDSATLSGSGVFSNTGTVNTATLNGGGFGNLGTVNSVTVNDSGIFGNDGTVNTATVSGGELQNRAAITEAKVTGGVLNNEYAGNITTAKVSGGTLNNEAGGTIGQVVLQDAPLTTETGYLVSASLARSYLTSMSGGTLVNSGSIDELTYDGGSYVGQEGSSVGNWVIGNADTTAETFGQSTIGNITFAEDGNGLLYITEIAGGSSDIAGKVSGVDLTNARILVESNLTSIANFDLLSLFGLGAGVILGIDAIDAFAFLLGEGDQVTVVSGGELAQGWSLNSDGAIAYDDGGNNGGNPTPEPATLLILGLGLAGLGLARRKRK